MGNVTKKISCKLTCKEIPRGKNSYTEKNISFIEYDAGKKLTTLHVREKFVHQRFGKNKIFQTKSPIPTLKVKWSVPYSFTLIVRDLRSSYLH